MRVLKKSRHLSKNQISFIFSLILVGSFFTSGCKARREPSSEVMELPDSPSETSTKKIEFKKLAGTTKLNKNGEEFEIKFTLLLNDDSESTSKDSEDIGIAELSMTATGSVPHEFEWAKKVDKMKLYNIGQKFEGCDQFCGMFAGNKDKTKTSRADITGSPDLVVTIRQPELVMFSLRYPDDDKKPENEKRAPITDPLDPKDMTWSK